ncbi:MULTISPECIES: hypothetical protein [unclassified Streptomyces]|uniref:hypothetical protein n=1 Tax=unclassified Streptomyces TaxID=2593676 RepID=UPI00081DA933|nr:MULTISPECIES: hypothetical protein [unclassified Streptomyces]MYR28732.1 hypothetical protein [Streptomyces sp. SID4945]SCF40820.1 hypothetical protein GA0115257_115720 [Streptomyces sp. LcepLS]
MAKYLIKYLDGESEEIEADALDLVRDLTYIAWGSSGWPIAFIPCVNVRSVVRIDPDAEGFRQQVQDEIAKAQRDLAEAIRRTR